MSREAAHAADLLAQLASPDRLRVLAELARRGHEGATIAELAATLEMPLPKAGEACARLAGLGLVLGTANGPYRYRPEGLRGAAADVDRMQPIDPLLTEYPQLRSYFTHGRLAKLPPTLSDRYELLGELLCRFLDLDGLYAEDDINRRLAAVTDNVAGVRRMLVDTGWLERDRAGTTYGLGRPLPAPSA